VVHQWRVRVNRTLVHGALLVVPRLETRRWIPFLWNEIILEGVAVSRQATCTTSFLNGECPANAPGIPILKKKRGGNGQRVPLFQ
jgi:hypothetical protein